MESYKELKKRCDVRGIILQSRTRKKNLLDLLNLKTLIIGICPQKFKIEGLYTLTDKSNFSWTSFVIKKTIPQSYFSEIYISNINLLETNEGVICKSIFNLIKNSLREGGLIYISISRESYKLMNSIPENGLSFQGCKNIKNIYFRIYKKHQSPVEKSKVVQKHSYNLIDIELKPTNKSLQITFSEFCKEINNTKFIVQLYVSIKRFMDYKIEFYRNKYNETNEIFKTIQNKVKHFRSIGMDSTSIKEMFPMYEFYATFLYNLETLINDIHKKVESLNTIETKKNLQDAIHNPENGLNSLIGRENIKNQISSQIYSFSQNWKGFSKFFHNFALFGSSGIGKTKVGKVLGYVFSKCGILLKDSVFIVSRSDLVGQYIGHTAPKTRSLLFESLEGVLFIDEAYQLTTSSSSRDFGHEAITEIVNFIDKYIGMNIVIVAGYEDLMKENFFPSNEGLQRRFPYMIFLSNYNESQLTDILLDFLEKTLPDVKLNKNIKNLLFTIITKLSSKYPSCFEKQAGDILNLGGSLVTSIYGSYKIKWNVNNFENCEKIIMDGVNGFLEMKNIRKSPPKELT